MAISLSINVADIAAALGLGYTHIKVYRSAEQASGFTEITTTSSLVALQTGVSAYTFIDGSGTTEHWYATTFFDINAVVAETLPSLAFRGSFIDQKFKSTSYPAEATFTANDYFVIDRIRTLIGDSKELTRDYVSVETGYSSISLDGHTHSLSNPRGWPLQIFLDGFEYTDDDIVQVNDFQFVTFSGVQVSTTSGILDVWYYHFRNSDTEILQKFNSLSPPPCLLADQVPFELAAVTVAIEILEAELRLFGVTSGSEVDIFEEIRINPKGGFDGRVSDLKGLRDRWKELYECALKVAGADAPVADGINHTICGVLID